MTSRRVFLASTAGALAGAPAAKRPNILFLFPDQLRFDWTGLNRSLPLQTPNLNKLAARGTQFTNAVVASPLCAPSRACLASGREYDRCGVKNNGDNYPLGQQTYYRLLRDSGYHVMACGKFDLNKPMHDAGLDGKKLLPEWGFSDGVNNHGKHDAIASGAREPHDPYMAYLYKKDLAAMHIQDFKSRKAGYAATFPTPLPEEAYCDNWLSANGLDLIRSVPKGKPWHLQVNFTGPHPPMDITRRMEQRARDRSYPQPSGNSEYPAATHVAIRQNYAAMIENVDRWVGTYLEELQKRGELENTLVVFSSDHGEMLGDHNRWGKLLPYQPSIGVPLIAAGPGVQKGATSGALVSIMDLAATYLDYAGVATPREMDSRSLRPLLEGKTRTHREVLRSGLNRWRAVWDGRYKLVTGFDPGKAVQGQAEGGSTAPLLFDLEADPLENTDIAAKLPEQVKRLSHV